MMMIGWERWFDKSKCVPSVRRNSLFTYIYEKRITRTIIVRLDRVTFIHVICVFY